MTSFWKAVWVNVIQEPRANELIGYTLSLPHSLPEAAGPIFTLGLEVYRTKPCSHSTSSLEKRKMRSRKLEQTPAIAQLKNLEKGHRLFPYTGLCRCPSKKLVAGFLRFVFFFWSKIVCKSYKHGGWRNFKRAREESGSAWRLWCHTQNLHECAYKPVEYPKGATWGF